jgi:hypothetical protein
MTDTTDRRQPDEAEGQPADPPPAALRVRASWLVVAATAVLVLGIGVVAGVVLLDDDVPEPVEVAGEFVALYASNDLDSAATYLAADVDPGILSNEDNSDPLTLRFREATGHRISVGSCEETGPDPGGTLVACGYTYHDFRSDEIGRGPFGAGSSYVVIVEEGTVVAFEDQPAAFSFTDPEGFSIQMWTPFAAWVSRNHPEAMAIMYSPDGRGWEITEESILLWDQYLTEWATEVNQES